MPTVYVNNAMKINEVISEGATMNAYYRDEEKGYWSFSDGYRDDESVKGPYFSNASMREILSTLGMNPDFEDDSPMPIDQFINLTTQWPVSYTHLTLPTKRIV